MLMPDSVLILTTSDFNYILNKHQFIAVLFFNSRSSYCYDFDFEFKMAANDLIKDKEPITLGYVDITKDACKHIAIYYKAWGTPTFLIFNNYGRQVEEYKGPLKATGFIQCLKRLRGDLPTEIQSLEYVADRIGEKPIMIVGFFPEFSGQEYGNFIKAADKFKWVDYEFRVTKHNPGGGCRPLVSLFIPDPFEDKQACYVTDDFDVHELVKFVEDKTTPAVIEYGVAPRLLVDNFFHSESEKDKAMLFINRRDEDAKAIEKEYRKVAEKYRGKDISFMLGVIEASQDAFMYFRFHASAIIYNGIVIRNPWGEIFAKFHVEADDVEAWVDDYKAHRVTEYGKSESIPEKSNELVKAIVADNFKKEVMDTNKNVLLELYRFTSGSFGPYAEMLNKVAGHYENDDNVIIAKLDETANDIRSNYSCDLRTVGDEPALYFVTAEDIDVYDGPIDHVDVIKYIEENRDPSGKRTQTE